LKTILAGESDSGRKWPRFSAIVEADAADSLVNLARTAFSLRRNSDSFFDVTDDLVKVLETLSRNCRDKRAWDMLADTLDNGLAVDMFLKLNGLIVLADTANELLRECVGATSISVLARWLAVMKRVASNPAAASMLAASADVLYALARCLFVNWSDPAVKCDLSAAWFLVVFSDALKVKDAKLVLPAAVRRNVSPPVDVLEEERAREGWHEDYNLLQQLTSNYAKMVKTFWNLEYFGGAQAAVDQNSSGYFAEAVVLSEADKELVRLSFPSITVESGRKRLVEAESKEEFLEALATTRAYERLEDQRPHLMPPSESLFGRFFSRRPKSRRDRALLIKIVDYLANTAASEEWIGAYAADYAFFLLFKDPDDDIGVDEERKLVCLYDKLGPERAGSLPPDLRPLSLLPPILLRGVLLVNGSQLPDDLIAQDVLNLGRKLDQPETDALTQMAILVLMRRIVNEGDEQLLAALRGCVASISAAWAHDIRSPALRLAAMRILADLAASSDSGSRAVAASRTNLWHELSSTAFNDDEVTPLREAALATMCYLLRRSADGSSWHGPVAVETLTGLVVHGRGAMRIFSSDQSIPASLKILAGSSPGTTITKRAMELATLLVDCGVQGLELSPMLTRAANAVEDVSSAKDFDEWASYVCETVRLAASFRGADAPVDAAAAVKILAALVYLLERPERLAQHSLESLRDCTCEFATLVVSGSWSVDPASFEKTSKMVARIIFRLTEDGRSVDGLSSLVLAACNRTRREALVGRRPVFLEKLERSPEEGQETLGSIVARRLFQAQPLACWPEQELTSSTSSLKALSSLFTASMSSKDAALDTGFIEKLHRALSRLCKAKFGPSSLDSLALLLRVLTNLCYAHTRAKEELISSGALNLILATTTSWGRKDYPRKSLVTFLLTGCTRCPPFRKAVCATKQANTADVASSGHSNSLAAFALQRSVHNVDDLHLFYRLILVLTLASEGRRLVCRSGLIGSLLHRASGGKSGFETVLVDLLLSLSAFADGRGQLLQQHGQNVLDFVLDLLAQSPRSSPALALARNLSFESAFALKFLRSAEGCELLRVSVATNKNRVALQLLWTLASAGNKAKTILKEANMESLVWSNINGNEDLVRRFSFALNFRGGLS